MAGTARLLMTEASRSDRAGACSCRSFMGPKRGLGWPAFVARGQVLWVALAKSLCNSLHRAGIPPRRAGNFSLSRQRKVTKRGALIPQPLRARLIGSSGLQPRGEPLRSRGGLVKSASPRTFKPVKARLHADACGCQSKHALRAKPRRPGGAAFALLVSTACSRASDGARVRAHRAVTSPPRERSGSLLRTRPASAELVDRDAGSERGAVQRIFFGDFLLGATRRKLPARRGGFPARCSELQRLVAKAANQNQLSQNKHSLPTQAMTHHRRTSTSRVRAACPARHHRHPGA